MKEFDKIELDKTIPGHTQKKVTCPSCKKRKRFVQFYNFTTNEYLDPIYGRCDREHGCGYFFNPYQDLKEQKIINTKTENMPYQAPKIKEVDPELVVKTLKAYSTNNLFLYLKEKAPLELVGKTFAKYFVGTAKNESTIFWQRNNKLQFLTAQKIRYNLDGHRDKSIDPTRLFQMKDGYSNCLFGEHLLFDCVRNPLVCLVESEKTAIIADMWLPSLHGRKCIWIATVGVNGATDEKIKVLKGFDICLVPDFSFHAKAVWGVLPMRKKQVSKIINDKEVITSVVDPDGEIVEDYVSLKMKLTAQGNKVFLLDPYPEIQDGSDIADYITDTPIPVQIEEPDYDALILREKNVSSRNDKGYVLQGERSFVINEISDKEISLFGLNGEERDYVEKQLLNPLLKELVNKFELTKGTIKPIS